MQIDLGTDNLQPARLSTHGIFTGKISSVEVVEKDGNGDPVKTPYVQVKIDLPGIQHSERFYITTGTRMRIKELLTYTLNKEIGTSVDSDSFKEMVGVEVTFKLVPNIDKTNGKVYYQMPYSNFIRKAEYGDTLSFNDKELEAIEDAKNIKTVVKEESKSSASDLPF